MNNVGGRRKSRRLVAEINITPFTDVVLVLLIIFMITTPLLSSSGAAQRPDSGFSVNLPKANPRAISGSGAKIIVGIQADGRIFAGGKEVTEEVLRADLQKAKANNPEVMVVVQADRMVSHFRVVRVMNLAAELGLNRLAIATDENTLRSE